MVGNPSLTGLWKGCPLLACYERLANVKFGIIPTLSSLLAYLY